LLGSADTNGDGIVDYEEFIAWVVGDATGRNFFLGWKLSDVEMKEMFEKYDADNSGAVDELELGCMLEDFDLLRGSEAENAEIMEHLFDEVLAKADEDHDGKISFEEFKNFIKIAMDIAKKGIKAVKAKTSVALSSDVEEMRKEAAARRARDRAERAAELAEHKKQMKLRLEEAKKHGRNAKKLSAEQEADRKKKEKDRLAEMKRRKEELKKHAAADRKAIQEAKKKHHVV